MEGHGTSTSVGDAIELQSMAEVLSSFHLPSGSVALGSVKSNIGHLKGAAGAAGLLKVILALHNKVLPPSVNFKRPNPVIDFAHSPLYVNTELRPWTVPADSTAARRPQRLWFWRHQLPRRGRRVHTRQAERKWQAGCCGQ